jgi:hypothetical protein
VKGRPHVVKRRRAAKTWQQDSARAAHYETLASDAIASLLEVVPEDQRPGLARAIVQEAVKADAEVRGAHEAAAWAAKQARAA